MCQSVGHVTFSSTEFKGDIGYFSSDNIVTADGSSQSINEVFVVKM